MLLISLILKDFSPNSVTRTTNSSCFSLPEISLASSSSKTSSFLASMVSILSQTIFFGKKVSWPVTVDQPLSLPSVKRAVRYPVFFKDLFFRYEIFVFHRHLRNNVTHLLYCNIVTLSRVFIKFFIFVAKKIFLCYI